MAVSMPDGATPVQVPGYRDRFGDRVVKPQRSGVLLEYLYFADRLAGEPYFAQALKERVARLSTFSHPSYCRVRRVQPATDPGGRPALVSVHVAGRRLAEVLDTAAKSGICAPTAAVMAAARQTMATVALLHDFAPDGFHGALGPDRLILAGDGRIVVAEHVLGGVVTEAAQAWGPDRLWRDLGVATMSSPSLSRDGRRNDVVQMGLLVLAMLLGRPIALHEYPDEIPWLVRQVPETASDRARAPLGAGLQEWLERTLSLAGDRSYTTLVDSQDALSALLRDERYTPSPAAWDAFVAVCETARASLPVTSPADEPPDAAAAAAAAAAGGAAAAAAAESDPASKLDFFGEVGLSDTTNSLAAWLAEPPEPPAGSPAAPAAVVDTDQTANGTAAQPETEVAEAPDAVPAGLPTFPVPAATVPPPGPRSEPARVRADLAPADGELQEAAAPADEEAGDWQAWSTSVEADRPRRRRRHIEPGVFVRPVLVLALLVAVGAAAAVYAPRLWAIVFDEQRTSGRLAVMSEPAGSSVTVDGLFRGLTPTEITLRRGSHKLEVQNGGALQTMVVEVRAGQRTTEWLEFPGVQDRGGLSISTYPAVGRVTVDGVPRGPAPVKIAGLKPGVHVVEVETPMGSQSQDVMVEAGKLLQVQVQTASWVKVDAPYDLEVSEDGRKLGTTGHSAVALSPGRHHLEFVNESLGLKLKQAVDARPGELTTVPLDLPMGTLNVTADAPAQVSIDGQVVGGTPLSGLAVPLGRHQIVAENADEGRLVFEVTVTLAAPVRITASFRK
jgi:hypothetical protein